MARYANWHSDQARESDVCGFESHPCYWKGMTKRECDVPWSNGDDTSLTKRKRGFDSLRDDWIGFIDEDDGPRVRRRHASLVRRWTEFDSRADLGLMNEEGPLVQREDAWLATRRSGFDSPAVHCRRPVRLGSGRSDRLSGSSPNGRAPPWRGGDPGSTPGGSTVSSGR